MIELIDIRKIAVPTTRTCLQSLPKAARLMVSREILSS
jgi:hypothetical protein